MHSERRWQSITRADCSGCRRHGRGGRAPSHDLLRPRRGDDEVRARLAVRHRDAVVARAVVGLTSAGLDAEVTQYKFCTNGSGTAGRLGIPTIGYGPGHEDQAHKVDEYIDLPDLHLGARWYAATRMRAARAERRLRELGRELHAAVFAASPGTGRLLAATQPDLAGFRVEMVTDVAGATALPWEAVTSPGTGQPLALVAGAIVRPTLMPPTPPASPKTAGARCGCWW
jgi:hypothetical protein